MMDLLKLHIFEWLESLLVLASLNVTHMHLKEVCLHHN